MERRLRRLGAEWHVVRDLVHEREGLKIDHLVIGRPGLFVISSYDFEEPARFSSSRDPVAVKSNVTSRAVHAARAVSRRLTRVSGEQVAAWPVIVVNGVSLDVKKEPGEVYVVSEQLLVPWLKSLVPTYSLKTVQAVHSKAASAATWSVSA